LIYEEASDYPKIIIWVCFFTLFCTSLNDKCNPKLKEYLLGLLMFFKYAILESYITNWGCFVALNIQA